MTTRLLTRPSLLEARLEAVVEQTLLAAAWNAFGEQDPHRVEIIVDDRSCRVLELACDLAAACGVALAGTLLERQGTDCVRWTVRALAWDEQIGAWILLREWCSQH